ncbi:MAG TPA: siroheme synthase, partial [Erwiniaceae bacterium]|nr:siroheme synthase [Erwiniaceae bacterium]
PSIVDRSPLVVAISSSGTAPVLARMLREKLEALLPANLGQMAQVAGEWRDKVKQRFSKMSDRRRFWERAFNGLFASQMAAGNVQGAKQTLDAQLTDAPPQQGEIILVGAGPGDAGLLTLRALQVMQ